MKRTNDIKRLISMDKMEEYFCEHDKGDGVMKYFATYGFPRFIDDECIGFEVPQNEWDWWRLVRKFCFDVDIDLIDYLYGSREKDGKISRHFARVINKEDNNK